MNDLTEELLDAAKSLSSGREDEPASSLRAALDDYTNVSRRLEDNEMSRGERAEWHQVRRELAAEVTRLIERLKQQA